MRQLFPALLLVFGLPALVENPAPGTSTGGSSTGQTSAAESADKASDAEMTAIYDADQAARDHPAAIDWNVLRPADQARRLRTLALLDADRLHSADDFYHAAFVFQHSADPDDFLKAHALAIAAAARGKPEAAWIAAATLDRYLQRIGQSQIYGTQFTRAPGKAWTQEPYRRDLLSDALRQASGVPPLAAQEQQRQDWARKLP